MVQVERDSHGRADHEPDERPHDAPRELAHDGDEEEAEHERQDHAADEDDEPRLHQIAKVAGPQLVAAVEPVEHQVVLRRLACGLLRERLLGDAVGAVRVAHGGRVHAAPDGGAVGHVDGEAAEQNALLSQRSLPAPLLDLRARVGAHRASGRALEAPLDALDARGRGAGPLGVVREQRLVLVRADPLVLLGALVHADAEEVHVVQRVQRARGVEPAFSSDLEILREARIRDPVPAVQAATAARVSIVVRRVDQTIDIALHSSDDEDDDHAEPEQAEHDAAKHICALAALGKVRQLLVLRLALEVLLGLHGAFDHFGLKLYAFVFCHQCAGESAKI
mmetsp:Transcript_3050/g.9411  ORF Transcript_3050/g.9411 Transcript_3050/m.9411 type:complete len:336 (+) Transcript_3050:1413-2420(+)